jgi:hypothetical protein
MGKVNDERYSNRGINGFKDKDFKKLISNRKATNRIKKSDVVSRLKRVVNGRHWRKNRRTKKYIHFPNYFKCYPL